jgi:hypothetical protein
MATSSPTMFRDSATSTIVEEHVPASPKLANGDAGSSPGAGTERPICGLLFGKKK